MSATDQNIHIKSLTRNCVATFLKELENLKRIHKMDWLKVEKIIGETVPSCVKLVLTVTGYNTLSSLKSFQSETIPQIEKTFNDNFRLVHKFDCCHSEYYNNLCEFKFLPGHADFLCGISKYFITVQNHENRETVETITEFQPVLKAILDNLHQSTGKSRVKYSDVLRYFATYVYLKAGRSCYEFLQSNLPLPSSKTICKYLDKYSHFFLISKFTVLCNIQIVRCIDDNKSRVNEGELRCAELSTYLERLKAEKIVWLAEDATAIVPKISYDPKTNRLVGLLLPLNNKNGCPLTFRYTID